MVKYESLDQVVEDVINSSIEASEKQLGFSFYPEEKADARDFLKWFLDIDRYRRPLKDLVKREIPKKVPKKILAIPAYALVLYRIVTGKTAITDENSRQVTISAEQDLELLALPKYPHSKIYPDERIGQIKTRLETRNFDAGKNEEITFEQLVNTVLRYEKCIEYFGKAVAYAVKIPHKSGNAVPSSDLTAISQKVSSANIATAGYSVYLAKNGGNENSIAVVAPGSRSLEYVQRDLQSQLSALRNALPGYLRGKVQVSVYLDPSVSNEKRLLLSAAGSVGELGMSLLTSFVQKLTKGRMV